MKNLKVISIDSEGITFEDGIKLFSEHCQDCCESHQLNFDDITLDDFLCLRFDLSEDKFFRKVENYGIELIPTNGWSIKIPGYGSNNGYYGTDLHLVIKGKDFEKKFDISECQTISD